MTTELSNSHINFCQLVATHPPFSEPIIMKFEASENSVWQKSDLWAFYVESFTSLLLELHVKCQKTTVSGPELTLSQDIKFKLRFIYSVQSANIWRLMSARYWALGKKNKNKKHNPPHHRALIVHTGRAWDKETWLNQIPNPAFLSGRVGVWTPPSSLSQEEDSVWSFSVKSHHSLHPNDETENCLWLNLKLWIKIQL